MQPNKNENQMEASEGRKYTQDLGKFSWKQADQRDSKKIGKICAKMRANVGAEEAPMLCNVGTEWD